MKPKKYNKKAQPEQLDHYGPTGPILSGDANSGSQDGFGGNVSMSNPVGGVNDIYMPENSGVSGGANDIGDGFGGSLSGNPSGGVNDVVNPENPKVPNSGNIYLNDNESV